MSLIQDALKKAQEDREKERGLYDNNYDNDIPSDMMSPPNSGSGSSSGPGAGSLFTGKRAIVYGSLGLVIIVAIVLVTVVFKPPTTSTMKPGAATQMMTKADIDKMRQEREATKTAPPESPTDPALNNSKEKKEDTVTDNTAKKETLKKEDPMAAPHTQAPEKQVPGETEVIAKNITKKNVTMNDIPPKPKQREISPTISPIKSTVKPTVKTAVKSRPKKTALTEKQKTEAQYDQMMSDGESFRLKGDHVMAVDRFKKALALKKSISVYLRLYSCFKQMGNTVLSRAYIDEGLKAFPNSFSLNKVSAVLYIRKKQFDKALVNIDAALSQKKSDYALLTYRGLCYFHKRNYEKALYNFRDSLAANGDAVENYYYIGLIYDTNRDYNRALEFYQAFFRSNDKKRDFKHRDWVLRRMEELKQGLRD